MPLDPPLDDDADAIREALLPLRNGASVAVHAAGNAFAVGAIIRTCHSFLVREIILVGTEPHYEKASMGMHRLETVVRVPDDQAFFQHVRGRPVWAFEREHARRSLYEADAFPEDVVLLFGSERFGIPTDVLERCDDVLGIPLHGVNNSLPVAVAAGIAVSWFGRCRYGPGRVVVGPPRAR